MSTVIRSPVAGGAICAVLVGGALTRMFFFGNAQDHGTPQERAVAAIKQAGGELEVDENAPDKPVVRVNFEGLKRTGFSTFTPLGDDGLAELRPHLENLPRLRYLRFPSMAMISDAGLMHLEGLTQLETIELYGNWLSGSKVTESGVDRLRTKLPNVRITYFDSGPPRVLGPLPRQFE
jgi:hypothetical protein